MTEREPRILADYLGKPPGTTDPRALKMKEGLRRRINETPDPKSVELDGIEYLDGFLEDFIDEVLDKNDKLIVPQAHPGEDGELWLVWPSEDGGLKLAVDLRSRRGSHSILVNGKGVRLAGAHRMIDSGWNTVRQALKSWLQEMRNRKTDAMIQRMVGIVGPSTPGVLTITPDELRNMSPDELRKVFSAA